MNRLTRGCFGSAFEQEKVSGFEFLSCGQMRVKEHFGHNAGWYNKSGEKIGWGDLNVEDVKKLMRNLQPGELFITVSEHDSFWKFVTSFGPIGSMCSTDPQEQEPGIDYLAEKSRYIIAPRELFCNGDEFWMKPGEKKEMDGITFTALSIDEIKELMKNL